MKFSEGRGLGVRVVRDGRLGYAWAADPSEDDARATVARARENAALGEPDPFNGLPAVEPFTPMPGLFDASSAAITSDDKVRRALDLERLAVSRDPRVTKVELAQVGDAVSRIAIASSEGVDAAYERTDAWAVVVSLATDGDETQTGFSFTVGRGLDRIDADGVAAEAVDRAIQMIGASKPPTARVPVILDPFAAADFLGVLAGALSADAVLKGRSLFAERVGDQVGSEAFTLVDDGTLAEGPAACPVDGEGVPSGRTELFRGGVLQGFLHSTYTARRAGGGQRSTANAKRGGYKSTPGVGTSNFFVEAGTRSVTELYEMAEGGVLINDLSGVHSGANPISGEFSVGATGLRIREGVAAEPLREMTIASTLPEMLAGVRAVGDDLRFFMGTGTPSIMIGEMTVAGV
jgi:PmbA protein